jgi:hypothetical protein
MRPFATHEIRSTERPSRSKPNHINKKSTELAHIRATHLLLRVLRGYLKALDRIFAATKDPIRSSNGAVRFLLLFANYVYFVNAEDLLKS